MGSFDIAQEPFPQGKAAFLRQLGLVAFVSQSPRRDPA